MDANSLLFSFNYNGKSFLEILPSAKTYISCNDKGNIKEYKITYLLADGLEIVQQLNEYTVYNACEWVLHFHNTSSECSGIISDLNDCDASFEFEYDTPPNPGYIVPEGTAKIYNPIGSNWARDEFISKEQYILPGQKQQYSPEEGRSSQGIAPFFDINRQDKGVICAVGWTGQWNACFTRDDKSINIKTGIEAVAFKLLPDEIIRTSSVVLHTYENGQNNGHNSFRRLVKEHFSLIGKPGRPENGPLSAYAWGALSTDKMLKRINKIREHNLGFEYYWIDAGWYGASSGPCKNEFEGDWGIHTGNWEVNTNYHPDGLLDVAKAIKESHMKFLLWIEPERVMSTTPTPTEHPEWFFKIPGDTAEMQTWLLNLGNKEALDGTIKLISDYIEKFDLGCYRQDFNTNPLSFWRQNDEPQRAGINEIKHIMGLYEFWDTLLERFPNLIIDNCASGGRRIDIETLRRSIPLWRSDYQCTWDCDPETTQIHNTGISWWIPYSGTGTGRATGDTYRFRSCYSSAIMEGYFAYEDWEIREDESLDWVRKYNDEYKRARPYFSCDYYPLAVPSLDAGSWTAWQYDRPEQSDGIIMLFRRTKSTFSTANFALGGMQSGQIYQFEDTDTGEFFKISSDTLIKDGFMVDISKKRSSKLYFYKVI